MSNKLTLEAIVLLNEGQQIKRKLESKYGSLKNFYEKEAPLELSLKAIRNYCSYPKVTSDAFKFLLINKLEIGWNEIVLTEAEQIGEFTKDVYTNIFLYKDEDDLAVLGKIAELCIEYRLVEETALTYRCLAKHFYFRNNSKKAIDLYHQAIDMLSERYINTLIILHVELADHLFMERNSREAAKHYKLAEGYTKGTDVNDHSLYVYNYRMGVFSNSSGHYQIAREYFNKALEFARINTNAVSETGATLMAIGSTYKREDNYKAAKDYYFKSLLHFSENDINGRGSAINNISDVYCKMGDYSNAISYIEQALRIFGKEGITNKFLVSSETYAQVKLLVGDASGCFRYFDILKSTINTSVNKKNIKSSICSMIDKIDDRALLNEFEDTLVFLIKSTTNDTYKDDLYSCIGRVNVKIKYGEV